jgi:hypothetical protein
MPEFGSFALLLALALSGYNLVAGTIALRRLATGARARVSPERLAETARRAGVGGFLAVTCAAFALLWAAFTNDFSVSYILHHSNRALPGPYKFAALWSGQEGSLLLWAWLLAAYGFVLRIRHKVDVKLTAYASTILAGIQIFFLLLLNFAAPPFALVAGTVHQDGLGLNPLLQYPEMVIHPPMLYLGYVGFSVPFAFALGALMMRYPGEKWIHITRRLDNGDVALSDLRDLSWRALGVFGTRMGRLLGLGSRGECFADAVADGHSLSAFGHDAGKTRHDEELERVAHLLDVCAVDSGHAADAIRSGEFGARICRIRDRNVVLDVPGDCARGMFVHVCTAA